MKMREEKGLFMCYRHSICLFSLSLKAFLPMNRIVSNSLMILKIVI